MARSRFLLIVQSLFTVLLLLGCASKPEGFPLLTTAPAAPAYAYPINNPYAATIIGVPKEMRTDYSALPTPTARMLTVYPKRFIPSGFWYEKGLRYSTLLQPQAAPLIYVIAGTGADHRSEQMRSLGNVFYSAGFHVVLLPSTTHPNFIVTASENFTPGRPRQSAKDLYHVMKMIDKQVAAEVPVTERLLTGYSLGGLDAAFTARLDEDEKALNFRRVFLINPPLSLYSSIQMIDKMLYSALPNGIDDVDDFIDRQMARLATMSASGDALDFQNERLFIDAYNKYKPSDNSLATVIGLNFRLFAANMIFTSDVMANTGYIYPKNTAFTTTTSLNNYLSVALRTSLLNYFNDIYSERYLADNPGMTKKALIEENSMESLGAYLSHNPKFGMMTNRDDIIPAPGEIDRLVALFDGHAKIYPNGGHLGNLSYPPVARDIVQFMLGQGVAK
ncbi:MAG: hypothetical protein JWM96_699 [Alphaproteobacteria bacterium]|nr:hypothetical protein [Alphaproteobacteria bacterium]